MKHYSVKRLARLSGVSVRTLHHYDKIGLLKPAIRTDASYRLYGEAELLRLQQILFYRELDFPLKKIIAILDDPDFEVLEALEGHRVALQQRQDRISTLLSTIDKTIANLKNKTMLTHDELYEGFPKEQAEAYRREATEKWGDAVEKSEQHLKKKSRQEFYQLKADFESNWKRLSSMINKDPASEEVQQEIGRHYHLIREFWGTAHSSDKQAEAYAGLGDLYVQDSRYTEVEGKAHPEFAEFMQKAMKHFAETQLK